MEQRARRVSQFEQDVKGVTKCRGKAQIVVQEYADGTQRPFVPEPSTNLHPMPRRLLVRVVVWVENGDVVSRRVEMASQILSVLLESAIPVWYASGSHDGDSHRSRRRW